MPSTTHLTSQQAIATLRADHPALLTVANYEYSNAPVSLLTPNTWRETVVCAVLHDAPELLPLWLVFLGLTDTDIAVEHLTDRIAVHTANATWNGIRIFVSLYQYTP